MADTKGLRGFKSKLPKHPRSDPRTSFILIILVGDRNQLTEKDPDNNARKLYTQLIQSLDTPELLALKKLFSTYR